MVLEISCIIAAVFFVASNVIGFSLFNLRHQDHDYTWKDYRNFHPELIQAEVCMCTMMETSRRVG
jgi:hypothetical protein